MSIQTKTMTVKSDTSLAETTTTIRDTVTFDVSKMPNGITYKGLKAVLSFADPIQWNKASTYDALTVVWDDASHGSYASKRRVPANIELTNEFYWLRTADLDAQVEMYRQEVIQLSGQVNTLSGQVNTLSTSLDNEITRATAAEKKLTDDLQSLALNQKNIVTPFTYGAIGDGVTDDTESISRWLNSGMTAVLPKGTFYVTDKISVTGPVTIIGAGGKIKIKSHVENDEYTFTFNDDTTIYGVEFESVHDNTVKGVNNSLNDVPCSNVKTIACRKAKTLNIVNCAFKNMYIAVFSNGIDRNTNVNIDSCLFDNVYSVVFSNNSNVAVNNCDIYINENANVYYHVAYPSQEGDIDYLKVTGNTVKYNPVNKNLSTFISANTTSELHQSIKDVIIMNNYVENMRILYLHQDYVNFSNFVFDSNTFVYDTNVLSGYVSIVSFIGGNIDMNNSNFINKTPALYLTSNKAQKINFNSCNFINFYVVGESGSTPDQGNFINFNSCTFRTNAFNFITANTTFSNCAINHTGTASSKTLFSIKTDLVKLIMMNTTIIGSGEASFVFSAGTTENNTHCISCVFENVQNNFLGAQKLTGCFRNEIAI